VTRAMMTSWRLNCFGSTKRFSSVGPAALTTAARMLQATCWRGLRSGLSGSRMLACATTGLGAAAPATFSAARAVEYCVGVESELVLATSVATFWEPVAVVGFSSDAVEVVVAAFSSDAAAVVVVFSTDAVEVVVVSLLDEVDPVLALVDDVDPVLTLVDDVDPVVLPPLDDVDPVVLPPLDDVDPVVLPPLDDVDPVVLPPLDDVDPVVLPPFDDVDPVVLPLAVDFTPVVLLLVDVEPAVAPWLEADPSEEVSAWATPAAPARQAQNPSVTAPVPRNVETLLFCRFARWRALVLCALAFFPRIAWCLVLNSSPLVDMPLGFDLSKVVPRAQQIPGHVN
jgi:hypothetical protein